MGRRDFLGPVGEHALLGGHSWRGPSSPGKGSASWPSPGSAWVLPTQGRDLQRWHGQNPAAHPLCGFESSGQLHSSLAASGLNYLHSVPAASVVCPLCHVAPFLPARQPSALEGLHSSPSHQEGCCELVSGAGGELADLGVPGPQHCPILRAPDLTLPICH